MFTSTASAEPLEFGIYEESRSNIRRLKESLPEDQVAGLAREVIRRLASRHSKVEHISHEPTVAELEELCTALISDNDTAAAAIIFGARAEGAPPEAIYLKYLAAAARMLGDWWNEDRADFVQVTVGTGRMFAIMRGMKHLFVPAFDAPEKSAIFASVPGEDHTFGIRMAADLFRKDGWEISLKIGLDHDELVADIERTPSSILGLSLAGRHSVDALSRLVVALHICCPHAPLLVSGRDVEDAEPLLGLMGVDCIARDLDEAREHMRVLWEKNQTG
ncbi:cobalamin B12-binding domain-containing protein [Sedimentitalea todarodis]|uniref:B12-binding domain-containing protein n=1 Tax=Sedimentitalea todarodis TaxID=1631240 RepID=A0ABU3VKG6_9RHOB|nr:hypothetical protein [Sedimentitalea todarodis]MDU9006677.1 hypothetical protein [Sedimentitalea todarodis]